MMIGSGFAQFIFGRLHHVSFLMFFHIDSIGLHESVNYKDIDVCKSVTKIANIIY